jgi:hypothetical protein
MSRFVFDGNYEVYFLPAAIGTPASPSMAAITAGTNLTGFIPKDGFNPGVTNNRVTGGALDTMFADESMGTYSSQLQIDCYLDDTTNTAFDTIGVQGTTGAIVAVPNGPAAVGVKAYVWPDVELGQPVPMQTAENTRQKFRADVAVRKAPNFHAIIAA